MGDSAGTPPLKDPSQSKWGGGRASLARGPLLGLVGVRLHWDSNCPLLLVAAADPPKEARGGGGGDIPPEEWVKLACR